MTETRNSSGGESEQRRVMVEIRVPRGSDIAFAAQTASGLNVPGFQLDTSYAPVPTSPSSDRAAQLEAAREEVFIVCGTIEEGRIDELRAQPNVEEVYPDTPIAPFNND